MSLSNSIVVRPRLRGSREMNYRIQLKNNTEKIYGNTHGPVPQQSCTLMMYILIPFTVLYTRPLVMTPVKISNFVDIDRFQ